MIYLNRVYQDSLGNKVLVKAIVKRRLVIVEPQNHNHPYIEYTDFSEALDPDLKAGHIGFSYKGFLKIFKSVQSPLVDVYTKTKTKKIQWTEDELFFPFFIAKWGYSVIGRIMAYDTDVQRAMIKVTSRHKSKEKTVANFRYAMGIPGHQASHISSLVRKVVGYNNNLTYTQAKEKLKEISKKIVNEL